MSNRTLTLVVVSLTAAVATLTTFAVLGALTNREQGKRLNDLERCQARDRQACRNVRQRHRGDRQPTGNSGEVVAGGGSNPSGRPGPAGGNGGGQGERHGDAQNPPQNSGQEPPSAVNVETPDLLPLVGEPQVCLPPLATVNC